ncbi:MAG: IPT/TIG domain-containing protein [Candidatus Magasanikbacteria bacterium]|nr:IPT/TIG domain-containing protein [Candidatus Magasanikbacteria bacterium]
MKTIILVALLVIGAGFFVAQGARAQTISSNDLGISYGAATGLGATDIRLTIARIIRAALGFLGVIAVMVILYGGFLYMTAGGNEEKVSEAKKILINGAIGLVIILSAFSIASFVVSKLTGATTGAEPGTGGGGGGGSGGGFLSNVFYVSSLPQAGAVCLRNISLLVVFSKEVDVTTLGGNIVVTDQSANNVEVAGGWKYGQTKNMAIFAPNGPCAPSAGNDCYKPETAYNLVFKNAAGVKTLDKNPELTLNCRYKAGCGPVPFKSGLGVDRLPPTVTITYPVSDTILEPGTTVPVKLHYSDDNGVQNLSLSYAKGTSAATFVGSASFSGCKQSADVTIPWPTGGVAPGTYTLSAIATDWAGLNGTDTQDATLRPNQCFNGVQDTNEAAIDCGGTSGCGLCQGGSCTANSQCASGSCVNGICRDVMRIDSFSPASGAPGTFVTISGRWFGETPGKVYFATTNHPAAGNLSDWKEAKVVNCGNVIDNWSERQILVEVPAATAASSPIKVEAAPVMRDGLTTTPVDITSNHNLPNFDVTTLVRPGICVLDPNHGQAGDLVAISGKNFGTLKSASDNITFGDMKAAVAQNQNGTPAWAAERIAVAAPAIASGSVGVTVTKDGVPSNSVRFLVAGGAVATEPFISGITPARGAAGDYITITGGNFGDTIGSVWFKATPTSPAIIGSFNFPKACQNNLWSDKKIIMKFPVSSGSANTNYLVQINTGNNRVSAIDSNQTFTLETGEPSPGICSITPVSGPIPFPAGQTLRLSGEYFLIPPPGGTTGALPTDVYFWSGSGNPAAIVGRPVADRSSSFSITATAITVRPPDKTITGPVSVYRGADQKISNPVNFSASDCRVSTNQCIAGSRCCFSGDQAGFCKPNAELCVGETRSSGYIWRFSTKDLPPVPHVVERCDAITESGGALPTPTPSVQWDANNQGDHHAVCSSALAVVEFSTAIDQATVNAQNVAVNRCTSVDSKNNCVNPAPQTLAGESYRLETALSTRQGSHSYLELQNTKPWDKGIWYQVVLSNKIKSSAGAGGMAIALSADKPCGGDSAYCFVFQGGGQACVLNKVVVTPYSYLTEFLEEPVRKHTAQGVGAPVDYVGNGLSSQRCIMMDVSGYAWQWATGNAVYAGIYNINTGRRVNVSAKANTVGIGLANDSVPIQATAKTNTPDGPIEKQGQSPLTIDLTNPAVVDYWPKCLEACTDADVAVQFNVSLSTRNIDRDAIERGAVKLNKCNDENCLSVTQVGVSSDVILDPQSPFTVLHIANSTNGSLELEPNQVYQVVISAASSDPAATNQIWSRARSAVPASFSKPYNQEFTWRFRTKKDRCVASRVNVTPPEFIAQFISDRQVYTAQPFSSPDKCSASGQKLNPWKVDWTWNSSAPAVATIATFKTKGRNSFCSSACVKRGSVIPSTIGNIVLPVCGNGKVEAGEDCDPPGKAIGCGLDCRWLGKSAASVCGNGKVEAGEACDPADPLTKIGCGKDCLRLGSLPAGAAGNATSTSICGNGTVGSGEDCDIGAVADVSSPASALGCSAKCLHLGTHLTSDWCAKNLTGQGGFTPTEYTASCAQAYSQCGDGVPEPEEDIGCDLGGGKHADWCNDYCLVNNKNHPLSVGCTSDTEGCDVNGQYLGSALTYSAPSVCGDGRAGIGEDPVCETNLTVSHDGLTDPWTLAIGVGKGVANGTPPAQRTVITAATTPAAGKTVSGAGKFIIACGYKTDADCVAALGDSYGVASDSCCYARPRLIKPTVPVDKVSDPMNGAAVCINTAIQAKFDQSIDPATVAGNFLIARGIGASDSCVNSSDDVTALLASVQTSDRHSWLRNVFNWALAVARDLLGERVSAKIFSPPAKWCVGDDLGTASVSAGPNNTSYVNVALVKPLAPETNYAIILKPGIKNMSGVSIGKDAGGKNISWKFDTRNGPPCLVDAVTIDPPQWYFSQSNATATLTARARSGVGNGVTIQSLPGFYSWDYIWSPTNNDSVSVPVSRAERVIISSKNTNGEATVRASANIIDNVFTNATGIVGSGTAQVVVFLCENPWPPKDIFSETTIAAGSNTVGTYTPTGYVQDIAFAGKYAFVAHNNYSASVNPGTFEIVNFTDPTHPASVATVPVVGSVQGVAVSGDYAYVSYYDPTGTVPGSILKIINIRDPLHPVEVGIFPLAGWMIWPGGISVMGDYAYALVNQWSVNSQGSILQVINIRDPAQPANVVLYPLSVWANTSAVASGGYVYFVSNNWNGTPAGTLTVVDARDPAYPTVATSYQLANPVQSAPIIAGSYIYIGDYSLDSTKFNVEIINISNPLQPILIGSAPINGWLQGVSVSGNTLYVVDYNSLVAAQSIFHIFDIRDPAHPTAASAKTLTSWPSGRGVYVSGDYAFLTATNAASTGSSLEIVTQQAGGTVRTGPFTIFPYEDASGNNDAFDFSKDVFSNAAIPRSTVNAPGVGDGYFNFSTYYCADGGSAGTFDDLPYLRPAAQTTAADLQGQPGVCEITGTSCQTDGQCENYYQSAISFAAPKSAASICGGTTSTAAVARYFLDGKGAPLACGSDTDCAGSQDFTSWKKKAGITTGSTCLALSALPKRALACYLYPPLKRFIFTNNRNSDAVGIQVFSNPRHLTPAEWYRQDKRGGGQGFLGAVQTTKIAGYNAVSDGDNVYIGALNYSTSTNSLYDLVYLLSVNSGAKPETRRVFDAFVNNFRLTTNLTGNDGYCGAKIDTPDYQVKCVSDLDCPGGQVCAAQVEKLRRDYQRIRDLRTMETGLETYAATQVDTAANIKKYPDLKEGTYLSGQTLSVWSSWSVLGNALGQTLPLDPVNQLGRAGTCTPITTPPDTADIHCARGECKQFCTTDAQCGAGKTCTLHDATTGWSTADRRFSFACPKSSYAYRYIYSPAGGYSLRSNIEDIGVPVDNLSGFLSGFGFSDASRYNGLGFNSGGPGICNNDQEVLTISKGSCGDGQVNIANGEQCDPPGSQRFGSCVSGAVAVDVCNPGCQWVASTTPSVSCSYLSKCGNGRVERGEACDDGALNGKYNHCNVTCRGKVAAYDPANPNVSPGFCGDGKVNPAYELCDNTTGQPIYATNSTDRNTSCGADCQSYGPYCGDGIIQSPREECEGNQTCTTPGGQNGTRYCAKDCTRQPLAAADAWQQLLANKDAWDKLVEGSAPVGWWRLDNSPININDDELEAKKAKDYSGNNYDGAISGAPRSIRGKFGDGISFNGIGFGGQGDAVTIGQSPKLEDLPEMSVELWYKPDVTNRGEVLVSKYAAVPAEFELGTGSCANGSSLCPLFRRDTVSGQSGYALTNVHLQAGTWYHLVGLDTGGQLKLYINGKKEGESAAGLAFSTARSDAVTIGKRAYAGAESYASGIISEVAIYNRVLSESEIVSHYQAGNVWVCQADTGAAAVNTGGAAAGPACGNGVVEINEACDNGSKNGVVCTPGYGKACSYCSGDCKNRIDVQPTEYCGDGVVQAAEVCDTAADGTVYAKSTTDPATTETAKSTEHNGYAALACASEPLVANIFKKGTKICANNCAAILVKETGQSSCVACGIDENRGVVVKGAILNVLEAAKPTTSQNPLYASVSHLGKIVLSGLPEPGAVNATEPGIARVLQNTSFSAYALQFKNSGGQYIDAPLSTAGLCSAGDSGRNYKLTVNDSADPFLFPIKVAPAAWQYDLILSPVISAVGLKDQDTRSRRPDDIRLVVSWVGDATFNSGFVKPVSGSPTIESLGFVRPITTGFDYYTKSYNDPAASVWGIWYHGRGQTPGLLSEESFTINTGAMQTATTGDTYVFYVRTEDGSAIKNIGRGAKLRVDVYLPVSPTAAPDYTTFSQPARSFQFVLSDPSDNPGASYWEVLKIQRAPGQVTNRIEDVTANLDNGRIVTGAAQF